MATDRRRFLALLALGVPVAVRASKQASTLTSPRDTAAANTRQAPLTDPTKLLIVDDEEKTRIGLAELVSSWGYKVETAADGVEGLAKAEQWLPAIVVTDLKMPRMTGMKLLEHLTAPSFDTTVVVVTAQGSIESAVEAMRKGAYDYIEKPVDTERLRIILQNASTLSVVRADLDRERARIRASMRSE